MTPIEQAREGTGNDEVFQWALNMHLQHGYVFSTPEAFMMARPVRLDWNEDSILNPVRFCIQGDCWHVYTAVGDLGYLLSLCPYPLPFLSFERKNGLRVYRFQKMTEKIKRFSHGVRKA